MNSSKEGEKSRKIEGGWGEGLEERGREGNVSILIEKKGYQVVSWFLFR